MRALIIVTIAAVACCTAQAQARIGAQADKLQVMMKTRMMARDADGDGRVSRAEFVAGAKAGKNGRDPAAAFARLDTDHDNYLSPPELDALLARRVARMDVNHDGTVTGAERAAIRSRAAGGRQ